MSEQEQAIRDLEQAWMSAVQRRDRDFLEELLGEEFVLVTGRLGHETRGREEWLRVTMEEYVIESFAFEQLEVFVCDGAAALARSRHGQRGTWATRTDAGLPDDRRVRLARRALAGGAPAHQPVAGGVGGGAVARVVGRARDARPARGCGRKW